MKYNRAMEKTQKVTFVSTLSVDEIYSAADTVHKRIAALVKKDSKYKPVLELSSVVKEIALREKEVLTDPHKIYEFMSTLFLLLSFLVVGAGIAWLIVSVVKIAIILLNGTSYDMKMSVLLWPFSLVLTAFLSPRLADWFKKRKAAK